MTKKTNALMRAYNSPAPTALRLARDLWALLGGSLVVYLQAFTISEHVYNIIAATIVFITSLLTGACIIFGRGLKEDSTFPSDLNQPQQ